MSFRKAQRGQETHDSGDRKTSPPEPRRDMCFMVVAESAFPSRRVESPTGPLEALSKFGFSRLSVIHLSHIRSPFLPMRNYAVPRH